MGVWFLYVVSALRPFMYLAINLIIVSGMFVCSSFLISVCNCVESFAHIECYSDCSRRGNHLVEPLCYGVI